ncbi:fatty-acyl-CoA synthase [Sphingomonas sp. PP-F2F-A104-K0414]|uniref:fatty acid--CoA ligase n=1 Tax=Sphingomonas sp. PP-F2F-A104-K0414 TaxID=2135661 RepID=UPI00105126D3|nr:fatty acid--CoA ligase [Sphingomonas sp. PP-F2F-A104-K0414]TCP97419.1 fatty-acyl-CoA synthase [Sphingomonas sp. PP-F2F-A104-K0414]
MSDTTEDPFAAPSCDAATDVAQDAYAYPLLLKHLLASGRARRSGAEIVYRDLLRYDYPALVKRVARLAHALTNLGLRPGDTIGMLDWDSHRYLESYFAIPGMGAVLHMVNVRLSPDQILYTINHARDQALLVHVDFLPMLEGIWDQIDGVKSVIVLTDGYPVPATRIPISGHYEELLEAAQSEYDFPDFDETTRATTFYTTGTTGRPKGVYFSHRQLVLHTLAAATALAASPVQGRVHRADVYMPITPMFHVHAWGMPFVATMLGLKQVYPGRYAPDVLLRLHQEEGVTISHCVPTILQMLLASPEAAACDLSGWKMIIGGSALTKGLALAAQDRGIDVFAGYGMSETCPILTIAQLTAEQLQGSSTVEIDARTRAGSPIPLVDLKVVKAATESGSIDSAKAGEIVVRAPWLTQGYVGDRDNSQALWAGGYLHTGDVGVLHDDGALQITDRIKDVIKTGGEWISSLEIEELILTHPDVISVAVIGVADGKWGERPLAVAISSSEAVNHDLAASIRSILMTCCDRGIISRWAIPSTIIFTKDLPKTSVGKIDKKLLRQQYGN